MFKIRSFAVGKRCFSSRSISLAKDPNLNQRYLNQRGEQPIPLSAEDLRSDEVKEIELPQATTDEKILIKNAMKKRSLRMTFLQLFLITLLSSSTLNVMRQKNELEEIEDVFQKELNWLKLTIEQVENGDITWDEIQPKLSAWNARLETLGLPKIEFSSTPSTGTIINKEALKEAFKKTNSPIKTTNTTSITPENDEKLDRFL